MNKNFKLHWSDGQLTIELFGDVNYATVLAYHVFYEDDRLKNIRSIIWDSRKADCITISKTEAATCTALAIKESRSLEGIRVAFLLSEGQSTIGVNEFIDRANRLSLWQSHLFYDPVEASAWLDERSPNP